MIMLLKCFLPLFLGISLISRTSSLKCYSCGEYEEDKNSCANFTIQDPKFSRECPEDTKSCRLTRKPNDNLILSRTCESIKLDDCKTANSIEFCYCTKDLCNAINPLNDDEDDDDLDDFFEGSGAQDTMERRKVTEGNSQYLSTTSMPNRDINENWSISCCSLSKLTIILAMLETVCILLI